MTQTQIEKARRSLHHAGTLEDRAYLRSLYIPELTDDIETLRESKDSVRADFKRTMERWRTERVPENIPIRAIPSDIHESRLYRITGIFALICEMGLAAWVFNRLGVAPIFGVLSALCITLTLHGVFLHVFDNPERPKETVHKVKCFASTPAIIGFLIALTFAVLARYVSGSLAILLLPFFSLALWLGTISLLILAAGLFTLAHIRGWSLRHEKHYCGLDSEERASRAFLNELEPASAMQHERQVAMLPAHSDHPRFDGRSALPAIALVALALSANTACAPALTSASTSATGAPATSQPAATLHIYIDWSGSLTRPALEEAWNTIKEELPQIAEHHRVSALEVSRFDEDGWCPERLIEIQLPIFTEPARVKLASSEWDSFANIRDAVRDSEEETWRNEQSSIHAQYEKALRESLQKLAGANVLPPADFETHNSDPVGLLRRIAETREPHPEFAIVLTDMADTRQKTMPKIPAPQSDIRVLVLIAPAKPKDAILTIGEALAGPEQFALRSRQLRDAAPWIAVAPHFTRNLGSYFKKE